VHRPLDELAPEGLVGLAVDGPELLRDYTAFPRNLETLVSHAGEGAPVLLDVSPLGVADPGRPWREFEFVSATLASVETCAVVGEAEHRQWLVRLAEQLLPEALVRAFADRESALAWLRS